MEQETQGPGQRNPQRAPRQNALLSISRVHLHTSRGPPFSQGRQKGKQTASRQVVPTRSLEESSPPLDPCWTDSTCSSGGRHSILRRGKGCRWRTENLRRLSPVKRSKAKQELGASPQRRSPDSQPNSSAAPGGAPTGRGLAGRIWLWYQLLDAESGPKLPERARGRVRVTAYSWLLLGRQLFALGRGPC